LRYLLIAAALLSPRPPHDPQRAETSLHPDLLPPLARLIAQASARTQVIVVSHAGELLAALADAAKLTRIVLHKELGETHIEADDTPSWTWPTR